MSDQPKRKRGRPPGTTKPEDQRKIKVQLAIRPDQREKLDQLGGSKWLRKQIDAAKKKPSP